MKKNGFTLAEVLITLAIIGVVASLTLPSLMTNTAEQQAITALRKSVNTLSEVGQMSAAVDGFDYSGITVATAPGDRATVDANGIVEQSVWGILSNRAQVDRSRSISGGIPGSCAELSQIFFMDGTALCYEATTTAGNAAAVIHGFIDTNGLKGPNSEFVCQDNVCAASTRTYGDQFPVTLKGSVIYPGNVSFNANGQVQDNQDANGSNAARWAMRK